ncbi:MAG: hypothetical protein R2707_07395 [Acidimicrobiales bacterium]
MTPHPTDSSPLDPTFARGSDTLVTVLASAAAAGYATAMTVSPGAVMVCGNCAEHAAARAVSVDRYRRLEGASDAADLMLVALVRCPHCEIGGTLTFGYGPNSGVDDDDFLSELDLGDATQRADGFVADHEAADHERAGLRDPDHAQGGTT